VPVRISQILQKFTAVRALNRTTSWLEVNIRRKYISMRKHIRILRSNTPLIKQEGGGCRANAVPGCLEEFKVFERVKENGNYALLTFSDNVNGPLNAMKIVCSLSSQGRDPCRPDFRPQTPRAFAVKRQKQFMTSYFFELCYIYKWQIQCNLNSI
jgi:hypothetical protein